MSVTAVRDRSRQPTAGLATPVTVCAHLDRLSELYAACFTEPPWQETAAHVATFAARLRCQLGRPELSVALSWDGPVVAGAAVGWRLDGPLPAPHPAYDPLLEVIGPWLRHRLRCGVHVAELMVDPEARHRGHGSALLRIMLNGGGGWLLTHRESESTDFYLAEGWHRAVSFRRADGAPLALFIHPAEALDIRHA